MGERRSEEIARGISLVGPHRDDVALSLGPMPAKGYASHGESWSLALALRLGSFHLLRADGVEPVLVLDDVFAELDAVRRERLARAVGAAEQVLVTAAVDDDVPARAQRPALPGRQRDGDGRCLTSRSTEPRCRATALEARRTTRPGRPGSGPVDGQVGRRPTQAPTPRPDRLPADPQVSGARPDDRDPKRLADAFEHLVDSKGWSTELNVHSVLARWASLVGPVNAEHSWPESYADGVLVVRAESTVWATSLRTMAPQLVARLNAEIGEGTVTRVAGPGPRRPLLEARPALGPRRPRPPRHLRLSSSRASTIERSPAGPGCDRRRLAGIARGALRSPGPYRVSPTHPDRVAEMAFRSAPVTDLTSRGAARGSGRSGTRSR